MNDRINFEPHQRRQPDFLQPRFTIFSVWLICTKLCYDRTWKWSYAHECMQNMLVYVVSLCVYVWKGDIVWTPSLLISTFAAFHSITYALKALPEPQSNTFRCEMCQEIEQSVCCEESCRFEESHARSIDTCFDFSNSESLLLRYS